MPTRPCGTSLPTWFRSRERRHVQLFEERVLSRGRLPMEEGWWVTTSSRMATMPGIMKSRLSGAVEPDAYRRLNRRQRRWPPRDTAITLRNLCP